MFSLILTAALASSPQVALLDTEAEGSATRLRFQPIGARTLAEPVASLEAVPGATVLGVLVPGSRRVAAVGQTSFDPDTSFSGSLFVLEAGVPTRVIADRLAVPQRPVLHGANVIVQRGHRGAASAQGRVDALTLDSIDLTSGRAKTIYAAAGFTAFPIGVTQDELVFFEASKEGTRLRAVHLHSLVARTITALEGPAFDFVLEPGGARVLFTTAPQGSEHWRVERARVKDGLRHVLARGATPALLPTPLADGRVGFAPATGAGLVQTGSAERLLSPRGPGFERVRAALDTWWVGLHEAPGAFEVPFAVRRDTGSEAPLLAPASRRLDIAGVTP